MKKNLTVKKKFHKFTKKFHFFPKYLLIIFVALFISNFTNKIDSKGRISLPAYFRSALSENSSVVVVYESFVNNCIEGCDLARIHQISSAIDKLDPFCEERDIFATSILGGSIQLSIDGDGRIILPEILLNKAEISQGSSAVFVGKGATFEIWQPEKFALHMENAKNEAKIKRNLLKLT